MDSSEPIGKIAPLVLVTLAIGAIFLLANTEGSILRSEFGDPDGGASMSLGIDPPLNCTTSSDCPDDGCGACESNGFECTKTCLVHSCPSGICEEEVVIEECECVVSGCSDNSQCNGGCCMHGSCISVDCLPPSVPQGCECVDKESNSSSAGSQQSECPDSDEDDVCDGEDNCPDFYNPEQNEDDCEGGGNSSEGNSSENNSEGNSSEGGGGDGCVNNCLTCTQCRLESPDLGAISPCSKLCTQRTCNYQFDKCTNPIIRENFKQPCAKDQCADQLQCRTAADCPDSLPCTRCDWVVGEHRAQCVKSCRMECINGFCKDVPDTQLCEEFQCSYRECTQQSDCTETYNCSECTWQTRGATRVCVKNCPQAVCEMEIGRCIGRNQLTDCPESACRDLNDSSSSENPRPSSSSSIDSNTCNPTCSSGQCCSGGSCRSVDCAPGSRPNPDGSCTCIPDVPGPASSSSPGTGSSSSPGTGGGRCEEVCGSLYFQCALQGLHCFLSNVPGSTVARYCELSPMNPGDTDCGDGRPDSSSSATSSAGPEDLCGNENIDSGEECDDGNTENNDGCSSTCATETCGDDIRQSNEECDTGSRNGSENSLCRFNCTIIECGDGVFDFGEECDDGNVVDGDGCDSSCQNESECIGPECQCFGPECIHTECHESECVVVLGEGINECGSEVACPCTGDDCPCQGPECYHTECQESECVVIEGKGRNECGTNIRCNDSLEHTVCQNQQCKMQFGPGNNECVTNVDCSPVGMHYACHNLSCRLTQGNRPNGCINNSDCESQSSSTTTTVATTRSTSLNGIVLVVSSSPKAGSSSAAAVVLHGSPPGPTGVAGIDICGDGILGLFEECDDSNRRDNDGCDSTCYSEIGVCGDGKIQAQLGEQCESTIHESTLPYGCSNCRNISPTCGDTVQDSGEECDLGTRNSNMPNESCRLDCSLPRCGDGVVDDDFQEQCDDGNRLNNDGCNRYCEKEEKKEEQQPESIVAGEHVEYINTLSFQEQAQLLQYIGMTPNEQNITLLRQGKIPISEKQILVLGDQLRATHGAPQSPYQMQYGPMQPRYQIPFGAMQLGGYPLPLAQMQPLIQGRGPIGDTGPAAVVVIGAGAAAGLSWIRRKRK